MARQASAASRAASGSDPAPEYARHRPEHTLLYRIIERHYPAFLAQRAADERPLPRYVQREFEQYLKCARLEYGFLRVRCERCHAERLVAFSCKRRGFCPSCGARRMTESAALLVEEVLPKDRPLRQWVLSVPFALRFLLARDPRSLTRVLGIVYRCIADHLIGKAGLTRESAHTGAVTFIQRFGSALNLNIHFHMLFLDGVYRAGPALAFQPLPAPSPEELQRLVEQIAAQVGRALERAGVLVRQGEQGEQAYLELESRAGGDAASGIEDLLAHSITYRIATGPHAGEKVLTLQTLPPVFEPPAQSRLAQASGFSLHAGIGIGGGELEKLERLCRYVSRPALATERLALTAGGRVRYTLKSPYRDGTTHVLFEPLDFLARLAALVPLPRVHLTRFHGLFAPHARLRAAITPAGRGGGGVSAQPRPPKHHAMGWMQRLKRAFRIDIETCQRCGGQLRVIASIEDPELIRRILEHLQGREPSAPPARAPPAAQRPD